MSGCGCESVPAGIFGHRSETAFAYLTKSSSQEMRTTPVEQPSLMGLTHSAGVAGRILLRRAYSAAADGDESSADVSTTSFGAVDIPLGSSDSRARAVSSLSMQIWLARKPLPVNGIPASSRNICRSPFSPKPPCVATKTTAFARSARRANRSRLMRSAPGGLERGSSDQSRATPSTLASARSFWACCRAASRALSTSSCACSGWFASCMRSTQESCISSTVRRMRRCGGTAQTLRQPIEPELNGVL
mmetsp:Transcript_18985/g.45333  ORF Transcript_18985/g.45333 Transcript_18985/m.45333 type:complete len:247 (+) Transcript_18985:345-1085(+)